MGLANLISLLNKLASLLVFVLLLSTHVLHADTVTYIITDPAGSPIAGMNQAGAVTWRENYQPFGEKLENSSSSADNDIWFAGKEFDDETGLSFFGARNYEPTIGRFVSIDPMGFDESNIQSFGRYAYGNNNPYKFVDPDGNLPILIPIIGFIVKEVAAEIASRATGGATDFLSVRRLGTKAVKSGLGDLTKIEVKQIQKVVDKAGRPAEVVGSAAKGTRRGVGTNLPIGKGPGTRSDIDVLVGPSSRGHFKGLDNQLPSIDPKSGIITGTHNPNIGPGIRFEPGAVPRSIL